MLPTPTNPIFRCRRQQRPQDNHEAQPWLVLTHFLAMKTLSWFCDGDNMRVGLLK
jgi:hypothetical protein